MDQVFTAIITTLSNHFGTRVETIAPYTQFEDNKCIRTPAILIELENIGEGDDTGTGQAPQLLSFRLHCLLSHKTPQVEIEVAKFASETLRTIRQQNFGLGRLAHLTDNLSALPGFFNRDKRGFESWQVTFELQVDLGETDFNQLLEVNPADVELITNGLE